MLLPDVEGHCGLSRWEPSDAELGAAAYAIKAARAAAPHGEAEAARQLERHWQREQLPEAIRELVLDDQRLRNDICWSVFDC